MSKHVILPWRKTCKLRPEIRERHLRSSDFAVDLHQVVNGWPGGNRPFYCDPKQFFATTYATDNLRQFCKIVLRRLAGENGGEAVINVAQTFGGGKSHTLTALYFLTTLGRRIPKEEISVQAILNDAGMKHPSAATVAAVSFDKVDWIKGCEVTSPDGKKRSFRMPWNLLAWQLLGEKGIKILARDESKPDHDTPPADTLWAEILVEVEKTGTGALILLDEFLMWAHDAASAGSSGQDDRRGPVWFGRLKNFFQRLTQAVESSQRSCLVVSLLASDPTKNDDLGRAVMNACTDGLNRQATLQQPVERNDLPELLRQRMFADFPKTAAERQAVMHAFWDHMQGCDPIRAKNPDAFKAVVDSYPFHPLLLDRFFGKWSELRKFQKTRGVLQIFAMALRDAETWDTSPLIGPQVFLAPPAKGGLSEALVSLATTARDSDDKAPPWPQNLETELPRALNSQKVDAGTLSGREIEAACVAAFVFSQPVGQQAELADLRWLVASTVEMPAVLNNGLISWAKSSWYLEECEATEAATGVPKFWRLGPKPNLNQVHESYKAQALKHARGRFDELAQSKCPPLYEGCTEAGVKLHKLPKSPADVEDDGQFRLVLLKADFESTPGSPPRKEITDFLRTHSSASDTRTFQNIVLAVAPSSQGLRLAEEQIANWTAWQDIEGSSQFGDLESHQQQRVRTQQRESFKEAATAVKNAYELVFYLDKTGAVQSKKITLGAQSLLDTLKQEKDLRIFDEKIDASAMMPGGLFPVWPVGADFVVVGDLYQEFGRQPALPKLLRARTVFNTIEDAVRRGLLALRVPRSDGSDAWFWKSGIDVADWHLTGEAWLPDKAVLNHLAAAVLSPGALPGLWSDGPDGVRLADICGWFDGTRHFEEVTEPGYPAEARPIPKVDPAVVRSTLARVVEQGHLWLVYGNDSVCGERPTDLQMDPNAALYPPPRQLAVINLLPGSLAEAWSADAEPQTTVARLYAALKAKEGLPWPPKKFMETVNAALAQGFVTRATGTGAISSLESDAGVSLMVVSSQPPPETDVEPVRPGGRRASNAVALSAAELQDFADQVPELMKTLAGCEPEIEVRIIINHKTGTDLAGANAVLSTIRSNWKMG